VFTDSNHPAYFYSAAFAYCKLDHFFRNDLVDRKFKPVRYHLIAGVRVAFTRSVESERIERKEGRAEAALKEFNNFLWDEDRYLNAIKAIGKVVEQQVDGEIDREFGRNRDQTERFFSAVLDAVKSV